MPRTFLLNFIKIRLLVSEQMFQIKVNAKTDGRMDARRTPGHDINPPAAKYLCRPKDAYVFKSHHLTLYQTIPTPNDPVVEAF